LLWFLSSPEIKIQNAKPLTLSGSDIKYHTLHCQVDGLIFLESREEAVKRRPKTQLSQTS
jgi:hypothetical protein